MYSKELQQCAVTREVLRSQIPLHCECFHKDGEKWRAFVHMVMNLCIPQNVGNYFRITNEILVCEELCSMELNSYIIVGWLVGWLVSVNYITAKIRVLFITPS